MTSETRIEDAGLPTRQLNALHSQHWTTLGDVDADDRLLRRRRSIGKKGAAIILDTLEAAGIAVTRHQSDTDLGLMDVATEERAAWDAYAAAYITGHVSQLPDWETELPHENELAELAGECADAMLTQRQTRFFAG